MQSWDDGNFYCAIGGGDIDLSNYLQKSGGNINGKLKIINNEDFIFDSFSAGFEVGDVSENGGSLLVKTNSLNSSLASGMAINGSYNNKKSEIYLSALGVKSGGGYGADLVFRVSDQNNLNEVGRFTQQGDLLLSTIQVFADNTSASSLPTGTIYRTSDGNLKIKY